MITTGLVKELNFISVTLQSEVKTNLKIGAQELNLIIRNNYLSVFYDGEQIWGESIEDDSMFGIESCDAIARMIVCMSNGDSSWTKYKFIE